MACLVKCHQPAPTFYFSVRRLAHGLNSSDRWRLSWSSDMETSNHDTNAHGIMRTTKPVIKRDLYGQLAHCWDYNQPLARDYHY